ncbi:hypothetical protein CL617_02795 [archaeon]|nr:hypothetical protein [archaeon]|tara:strand:- start:16616 stop:16921 length:306 start_codon:yes stop_codon:yes gene_type:complete
MNLFEKIKNIFYSKKPDITIQHDDWNKKLKIERKKKRKRRKFDGNCNFCKKIIKKPLVNSFHCKYCNQWYCENHKNPETHNCKGRLINPHSQETADSLRFG